MYFLKSIDYLGVILSLFFLFILFLKYFKYKVNLLIILFIVFLLICTTSYIPMLLIYSIESKQAKINIESLEKNKQLYIIILGSSNKPSSNNSAFNQLHNTSQGRLIEALRIKKRHDKYILVTLGKSFNSAESNASMMRRAAIEKGVSKKDIIIIETPTSTFEEANSIKLKIPNEKKIILVTDALHMARAYEIFSDFKYSVVKAPTNYLIDSSEISFKFPNKTSYELMELYINTKIKQYYYELFFK